MTIDKPTSDFTCSHCGEGLRDDLLCDGCRGCHTHCPYSGAELFDECGHLLFYEGLDGASCPVLLPTELPHLAEEQTVSDDQLQDAFGDVLPVAAAYDYLDSGLFSYTIAKEMVALLTVPVRAIDWACDNPMLSSMGIDYYTDQRDAAIHQIERMLDDLAVGFRRLAHMPPPT